MLPSEELIAAFLIGFALGTLVRNEQLKKATEQRDRAENMLRNVSKEYAEIAMDCVNAMDRPTSANESWKKSGRSMVSSNYIKVTVCPGLISGLAPLLLTECELRRMVGSLQKMLSGS